MLASIVESSDDAIISKDLNGVVTSWNKSAERMFGYRAEEVIGRPISVIAAPDRRDEMPEIMERIKRGERIDHYETIRRTKSGKLIYVSLTISPVHDASGRITGASKISRDITARVLVQREVAEQRERLRVILSSIGDAVISTDAEGRIVFANIAAQSLLGAPEAEVAGKHLDDVLKILAESPRAEVESPVTTVLRDGAVVGPARHILLIARDGTEIPVDFSGAALRSDEGPIHGTVLVFRDIKDRKRMGEVRLELMARDRNLASEKALRETEVELARIARALTVGELAVSIAHEVNQPLAGVVTNAEASLRWLSAEHRTSRRRRNR